jgi:hypothetical protein
LFIDTVLRASQIDNSLFGVNLGFSVGASDEVDDPDFSFFLGDAEVIRDGLDFDLSVDFAVDFEKDFLGVVDDVLNTISDEVVTFQIFLEILNDDLRFLEVEFLEEGNDEFIQAVGVSADFSLEVGQQVVDSVDIELGEVLPEKEGSDEVTNQMRSTILNSAEVVIPCKQVNKRFEGLFAVSEVHEQIEGSVK